MLLAVAATLSPQEAQVQIALITGGFLLLGTLVTVIGARIFSHPKNVTIDPDQQSSPKESLLATFSGDQTEFMHMVIEDNKKVYARLDGLDEVVKQMKKERTQFLGAVGRYISKLVAAWGDGGKMPYPDDADFALLEETLPADWRRRIK